MQKRQQKPGISHHSRFSSQCGDTRMLNIPCISLCFSYLRMHDKGLGMAQLAKWLPHKPKDPSLVSGSHVEKPGVGVHVLTIPALGSGDRKVSGGVG